MEQTKKGPEPPKASVLFSLPSFGNYGKTKVALIGQIVKRCQVCKMIFFLLEDEKSNLFGFLGFVPRWHKPFLAPAVPVIWVLGSIPNKQKGTGIYRCPACEVVNR